MLASCPTKSHSGTVSVVFVSNLPEVGGWRSRLLCCEQPPSYIQCDGIHPYLCLDLFTSITTQVQRLNTEREDMQSQNDSLKLQLKDSRITAVDALKQSDAAAGLRGQNRQLQQSLSKLEAFLGPGSAGMATAIVELELQIAELQAASGVSLAGEGSGDGGGGAAGDLAAQLQGKKQTQELQQLLVNEQVRTEALTHQVSGCMKNKVYGL